MKTGYDLAYGYVRNINGIYRATALSGLMGAGLAGDSEILQFRWTSTTKLAFIHRVHFKAAVDTTGFTAGVVRVRATIARAFTAAGTGGGTLTMTGNNAKMHTGMPTSAVAEIRVATTAALGAGTKTLDDNPIAALVTGVGTAAGQDIASDPELFDSEMTLGHPLVLSANEGLVIVATVPATGTWRFGSEICWAEGELR